MFANIPLRTVASVMRIYVRILNFVKQNSLIMRSEIFSYRVASGMIPHRIAIAMCACVLCSSDTKCSCIVNKILRVRTNNVANEFVSVNHCEQ